LLFGRWQGRCGQQGLVVSDDLSDSTDVPLEPAGNLLGCNTLSKAENDLQFLLNITPFGPWHDGKLMENTATSADCSGLSCWHNQLISIVLYRGDNDDIKIQNDNYESRVWYEIYKSEHGYFYGTL
jgi:hypothetical protein